MEKQIWNATILSMETKFNPRIVKIYYHWLIAESVREALKVYSGAPKDVPDNSSEEFAALMTFAKMHSDFNVIKVWYALLYVVIEEYQERGLSDTRINELLADEKKVDSLRRFRNAIFHAQNKILPEKEIEFLEEDWEGGWIKEVNKAFKSYFESYPPVKELLDLITN